MDRMTYAMYQSRRARGRRILTIRWTSRCVLTPFFFAPIEPAGQQLKQFT